VLSLIACLTLPGLRDFGDGIGAVLLLANAIVLSHVFLSLLAWAFTLTPLTAIAKVDHSGSTPAIGTTTTLTIASCVSNAATSPRASGQQTYYCRTGTASDGIRRAELERNGCLRARWIHAASGPFSMIHAASISHRMVGRSPGRLNLKTGWIAPENAFALPAADRASVRQTQMSKPHGRAESSKSGAKSANSLISS
jgi:hypothetical protein